MIPKTELISLLKASEGIPESPEFREYSENVRSIMSGLSRRDAAQLILEVDGAVTGNIHRPLALYPLLKEFDLRFESAPELLVVLFDLAPDVHLENEAADYLRRAYEKGRDNEFVLWQLLIARRDPWFPKELMHSSDPLSHDLWVIRKLSELNPSHPVAPSLKKRLEATGRHLYAKENLEFANKLGSLVPHPLKGDTLRQVLLQS